MLVVLAFDKVAPKYPLSQRILYGGVPPETFIVIVDALIFGEHSIVRGATVITSHSLVAVILTQGCDDIQVEQLLPNDVNVAPTDEYVGEPGNNCDDGMTIEHPVKLFGICA
jgi:hypothetical protein